ncbi:hypothetical protein D3C84_461970 [compost metagenome]
MAHARQEAGLGDVGGLGLLAGLAEGFLGGLEDVDVDVGARQALDMAVAVAADHATSTEQPVIDATVVAEAVFNGVIVARALLGVFVADDDGFHVVGVNPGVEAVQRHVRPAQAETLDEAALNMDAAPDEVDCPEAFGGGVEHQFQLALGLLAGGFAVGQLFPHGGGGRGHLVEFGDVRMRARRVPVALADLRHHAGDAVHRLLQLVAELARTQPHGGEEQQVEQDHAGDQQVADLLVAGGEGVGLAEDRRLVDHGDEFPAGFRDGRPGGQFRLAVEVEGLDAGLAAADGLGQVGAVHALGQVEVGRLEDFLTDGFVVGVLGQFGEGEVLLALWRQGHDVQLATDQHGVAVPAHL